MWVWSAGQGRAGTKRRRRGGGDRGGALRFELAFPFFTPVVIVAEFHGLPAIQLKG